MDTVRVKTASAYDVCIGAGLLSQVGSRCRALCKAETAAVVSDDTVFSRYGQTVCVCLESAGFRVVPFVFPHGEASKNLSTYAELLQFLAEKRITRADLAVALGGGVVGDLTGFAAATYLRGISYVQIPTTLLAAVDSSVGGKTGIDLPAGKNLVGCFYQPSLVLTDTDVIAELPEEVFRCGCAEVIKYAMLDEELFASLAARPVKEQLANVICRCVQIKSELVRRDEHDLGDRRLLNFGHTFAHAVEVCSRYTVPHGDAVAVGMAMMTRSAVSYGSCDHDVLLRLTALLAQYGLPTETDFSADMLFGAICADKKIGGEKISLLVPRAVGKVCVHEIPLTELPCWLRAGGAK